MDLIQRLQKVSGKPLIPLTIDKDKFNLFRSSYVDQRPGITVEKLLEYYISFLLLNPTPKDVYMDVAAQNCPFAYWVKEKTNARIYLQDLYYIDKGIQGEKIGGSACDMPLPDASVTKMSLHCSFEHFEDDNDILFIKEVQRLLSPGGNLCIVPLYVGEKYSIDTEAGFIDKQGRKQLWEIGARFVRIYDPETFHDRILRNAPLLDLSIYSVVNAQDIDPSCYVRFVGFFTRR